MFEIRVGNIRGSCEELQSLYARLGVKESMMTDLLAEMKRDETFVDSVEKLKRDISRLDSERVALSGLTEDLYTIENRYRRCESDIVQKTENCTTKTIAEAIAVNIVSKI